MDPLVGRTLGPYELQGRLGAGGMGTVYLAVHRRLRQQRAVKVLPSNLAADPTFVQRFEREARLAAELRHPNIVVVHDVDDADGTYFIAMELLQGRSLRDLIREEWPVPGERSLQILEQLALALDYAHARGVVHRDIKPGNVFVGAGDHVTLVDFGIARAADGTALTGNGVMGTPEYMAPEMLTDGNMGQSTDLYALGVMAFEMLSGRLPFLGANTPAVMYAQVHTPPPPLRSIQPALPPGVEDVVARQLSKQPGDRFASAGAFVRALRAAISAEPATTFDPDLPLLAQIAASVHAGAWQAALHDLERVQRPMAPAAQELRQRAEALRERASQQPRAAPLTPQTLVPPRPPQASTVVLGSSSEPLDSQHRLLMLAALPVAVVLLAAGWLGGSWISAGRHGDGAAQASVSPTSSVIATATRPPATPTSGAVATTPTTDAAAPTATAATAGSGTGTAAKQWTAPPSMQIDLRKTYTAIIKTSLGDITVGELYHGSSPNTVNNFIFLARQGFYDGVIFHRIIKDFMVQTGDPTGTGRGGPGYLFADEIIPQTTYTRGKLAMANAGPNTQGSQFFICQGERAASLPKNYTTFARVTEGLDVLDAIASVPVKAGPGDEMSSPIDPPRILTIEIRESGG